MLDVAFLKNFNFDKRHFVQKSGTFSRQLRHLREKTIPMQSIHKNVSKDLVCPYENTLLQNKFKYSLTS